MPANKFYLADTGFGACDALLTPYHGAQYHLAEGGHAAVRYVSEHMCFYHPDFFIRPETWEELYNLQHAQACNVVEHIFGVVKKQWDILTCAPHYDMSIQAQIPPALAVLHNFIMKHDPSDVKEYLANPDIVDPTPGVPSNVGTLAEGYVNPEELQQAKAKRDDIVQKMWDEYQHYLQQHPELMNEGD